MNKTRYFKVGDATFQITPIEDREKAKTFADCVLTIETPKSRKEFRLSFSEAWEEIALAAENEYWKSKHTA